MSDSYFLSSEISSEFKQENHIGVQEPQLPQNDIKDLRRESSIPNMQRRTKHISFTGISRRRVASEPEESQPPTPLASAKLIQLLSNPRAPINAFIFKSSDSSVNIFSPDKIPRKKSLQLHPKNIDTAGPDINNNSPSRSPDFIRSGTMDDFTSAFADADSPSRRRRGARLLDLSILQELQQGMRQKPKKTKDFTSNGTLRRKSCYCTCCGGLSNLEKKNIHLPSSLIKREFNEVVEQAKALIKPQKVTKKAAFFDKSPSKAKKVAVISIDEPVRQRSISISSKTAANNGSKVLDNAVFDVDTRNRTRSYNSRQDLKNFENEKDSNPDLGGRDPLRKMKLDITDNKEQQPVQHQQEIPKKPLSPQKNLPANTSRSVPPKTNSGKVSIKITKVKANTRIATANTQIRDPSRRGARVVKSSVNIKPLLHPPIQETPGLSQSSQILETISRSIPTNAESFISSSNSEIKDEKIYDRNYIFTPPTEHPLLSLMTQRTSIASQKSYVPPQNYAIPPKKRALSLPKLRLSASPPKNTPNDSGRFLIVQRAQRDERVAFVQSRIDNIKKLYFNSQRALLSPDQSHNLSREKSIEKKEELESNQSSGVKVGTSFNRILSGVRDLSSLQTNRAYLHTKKLKKGSEKNFVTLHQIANVFPKYKRKF